MRVYEKKDGNMQRVDEQTPELVTKIALLGMFDNKMH